MAGAPTTPASLRDPRVHTLTQASEPFQFWLRNGLLPGVVILVGGILLARACRWIENHYRIDLDQRLTESVENNDVASERLKHSRAALQAIGWASVALVYTVTVSFALHVFGVPFATLVAPATVVGVALGFGAQQVVADLLAGFFLFAEHQFGYGDEIRFSQPGQTDGVEGVVEEMTLRVTKLRTIEGEMVIVRNSELGQVTNMSKEWSQAVLDIPVAPGEDLELASSVMRTAAESLVDDPKWAALLLRTPTLVGVQRVEVGYVLVRVTARTLPGRQFEVMRELRLRCATAMTEAGVASPHIDLYGSGPT